MSLLINLSRCIVVMLMLLPFSPIEAAESAPPSASFGARLEPMLEAAQSLSPAAGAAALNAEAALDRVGGAGTLPDPTFQAQYGEVNCMSDVTQRSPSCAQFTLQQEFPLWGKRGLAKNVASAQATQAAADRDSVRLEVTTAVKQSFAAYFVAFQSARITDEMRRTVATAAEVAQKRYEQALGSQQDALALKVELAELDTARTRREADQRRAAAKLNALLNRSLSDPLASPEELPAVPNYEGVTLENLMDRARQTNPALKAQEAAIAAASGTKTLAEKSWYPDVTLGVSTMSQAHQPETYAGMVSLRIPLNAAQRHAEISAATAEMGAAQNKRDAAEAEIRGNLEIAYWNLKEAQDIAAILHKSHIPQADLALKSALSGYSQNRVALTVVLDAERHVLENQMEHLTALLDQQKAAADIERLIGGPL